MSKDSLSERFNSASTLSKALITAGVVLAFLVIAMVAVWPSNGSPPPGDRTDTPAPKPAASAKSQIQTIVVRQEAEGYTNDDLTPETLKRIEQELVRGTMQRAKEHVVSQGFPAQDITAEMFHSSSWVMEAGGRRFGVVDIHAGPGRIKAIISIQDAHFIRVSCIDPSGANIPTFSGPCADKIQQVFGVRLPLSN